MRVDTSEIKSFRKCPQQWKYSSRNAFNLRPKVRPTHFQTGTVFHEALHKLYTGSNIDKVLKYVEENAPQESKILLLNMVAGYYLEVLPNDLKRFKVIDIEHSFKVSVPIFGRQFTNAPDLDVHGSIDMVVVDESSSTIYGFEHKTCKTYRNESFMYLDEQPRVYSIALMQYVEGLNEGRTESETAYKYGGIFLNEVRKLIKKFDYRRTLLQFTESDLNAFWQLFVQDCNKVYSLSKGSDLQRPLATPDYFKCQMCDYSSICSTFGYKCADKDELLEEFSEEYENIEVDHLDEKREQYDKNNTPEHI